MSMTYSKRTPTHLTETAYLQRIQRALQENYGLSAKESIDYLEKMDNLSLIRKDPLHFYYESPQRWAALIIECVRSTDSNA